MLSWDWIPATLWFGILSSHQIKHSGWLHGLLLLSTQWREKRSLTWVFRQLGETREKREACQLNHGVHSKYSPVSCLLTVYIFAWPRHICKLTVHRLSLLLRLCKVSLFWRHVPVNMVTLVSPRCQCPMQVLVITILKSDTNLQNFQTWQINSDTSKLLFTASDWTFTGLGNQTFIQTFSNTVLTNSSISGMFHCMHWWLDKWTEHWMGMKHSITMLSSPQ